MGDDRCCRRHRAYPIDLSYLAALTHIKNALHQMLRLDLRRVSAIYQQLLVWFLTLFASYPSRDREGAKRIGRLESLKNGIVP